MLDYKEYLDKGEQIFIQGPWGFICGNPKYLFKSVKNSYTEADLRSGCDDVTVVSALTGQTKLIPVSNIVPFKVGEVKDMAYGFEFYGCANVAGKASHDVYLTWDGKFIDSYLDGPIDYNLSEADKLKGQAYGRFIEGTQTKEDSQYLVDPTFKKAVIRSIWLKAEQKVEKMEAKFKKQGLPEDQIEAELGKVADEAKVAMSKLNAIVKEQKKVRDLTVKAKAELAKSAAEAMEV